MKKWPFLLPLEEIIATELVFMNYPNLLQSDHANAPLAQRKFTFTHKEGVALELSLLVFDLFWGDFGGI